MKTILISGASSGFGKLTAQTLARQGHTVLAGVRDSATRNAVVAAQLLEFAQRENASLRVVDLDVTDDESARCAVRTAIEQSGRLDVVVNNAGVMYTGPLEAFTPEQAREQFETNVIGVLRLIRAALPHMRTRREGLLIQISSVLGRIALPLSGLYSASKFALEGLSEAYWQELQEFGIDVVVVEPGSYPTAIWRRGVGPDDVERLEAYAQADEAQTHLAANRLAADPQDVASAIGRLIALPARTRPMRLVVADEPERRGADMLNTVSQQIHEAIRGPRTGELAGTHS